MKWHQLKASAFQLPDRAITQLPTSRDNPTAGQGNGLSPSPHSTAPGENPSAFPQRVKKKKGSRGFSQVCLPALIHPVLPQPWQCDGAVQHEWLWDSGRSRCGRGRRRSLPLLCCIPAAFWVCLLWCRFLHCVSMTKAEPQPCRATCMSNRCCEGRCGPGATRPWRAFRLL